MQITVAHDSAGEGCAQPISEPLRSCCEVEAHPQLNGRANQFSATLSERGIEKACDRAIQLCDTDIGAQMAANKVPDVRAAQFHGAYAAGKAATSTNAQIITMGARVTGSERAINIVDADLSATFEPKGRAGGNGAASNSIDEKVTA